MSYTDTALLLPMNGADAGTSFPDLSRHNRTVTAFGTAQTSTAQSKFYGSSLLLDGNSDYLQMDGVTALNLGTADFVFSAYIYLTAFSADYSGNFNAAILAKDNVTSGSIRSYGFNVTGTASSWTGISCVILENPSSNVTQNNFAIALSLNTWYHIYFTRVSGVVYGAVDGTVLGSEANTRDANPSTSIPVRVGANNPSSTFQYWFPGHINDVQLQPGVAGHTTNFTPAKLIAPVAGTITDDTGSPVERRIWVIPREASFPGRVFEGLSDSVDGTYSIDAPNQECTRIVFDDDAGTQYNDIIDRVAVAA